MWRGAPGLDGDIPDPQQASFIHTRAMDRIPLHRRSVAVGAIGLAVLQGVTAGVFWAGFRVGVSDQPSTTSQTIPDPETTLATETSPVPTTARHDPCSPDFEEPAACIVAAAFDDVGDLIVEIEYRNVDPDRVGFDTADDVHAHVFPSDQPVESVGMPEGAVVGGGDWTVTDRTELRVNRSDRDFLSRTGEVCVGTATNVHTLRHLHTSCVTISR